MAAVFQVRTAIHLAIDISSPSTFFLVHVHHVLHVDIGTHLKVCVYEGVDKWLILAQVVILIINRLRLANLFDKVLLALSNLFFKLVEESITALEPDEDNLLHFRRGFG